MAAEPPSPVMLVGVMRVRKHCTFSWERPETADIRTVEVRSSHCPQCIAELRQRGFQLVNADGSACSS